MSRLALSQGLTISLRGPRLVPLLCSPWLLGLCGKTGPGAPRVTTLSSRLSCGVSRVGQEETFITSFDLYSLSKKKRKRKKIKSDVQLDSRVCIMYLISLVCIYNWIGLARKFVWVSHIVSIQKNPNELFDPPKYVYISMSKNFIIKFIGEDDQIGEPCSNVS